NECSISSFIINFSPITFHKNVFHESDNSIFSWYIYYGKIHTSITMYDIHLNMHVVGGFLMKILFVCTANTCRSRMAEALVEDKMIRLEVRSEGICAGET